MESALKNLQIHFNQLAAQLEWLRGTTECRLEQCDASEHPISAAGRRNPVAHYFQLKSAMDLYSTSTATAAAGERTSKLFQIHAKLVDIHAMLVDLKANASHLPELKSIAETLKVLQYMEKSYLGIPQTTATTAASAADDILVEKEEEMENLVQQKIINGKPPTDNTSAPKAQPKLKIVAPTKKISSKKILSSSATFKVNNADSTHTTNTSTTSPFSSYLDSTTSTTTPPPTISLEAFLSVSSLVRGRITLESVNKLLAILQQYFSNPKNMKHSSSLTLSQLAKLGVKPGKTTESQLKVLRQLGVVKIDSQGVVHRPLSANASSTRSSVRM